MRTKKNTSGIRIGTKPRDMRWKSADGQEWASEFEWKVYDAYRTAKAPVRRTNKADSLSYALPVNRATCATCGGTEINQLGRHYTPDLFYDAGDGGSSGDSYFIEVKGYLRAPQRTLLRAFCKARKDTNLRFIYQRNFHVSKSTTIGEWTSRFLKRPWAIWNGKPVEKWNG